MANPNETDVYYVRATTPAGNEQVAFKCAGMATAHAKGAELRMTGHRDVVMSVSAPGGSAAQEADLPLLVE